MNIGLEEKIQSIINLINEKEFSKAKSNTEKIIEDNPSIDILFNILGIINLQTNNIADSIENFKKAIKINNKFLSAYANLAIAYSKLDLVDDSIESYEKAISLDLKSYKLLNDVALLYKKNKNFDKSINYLLKAIEINPNYEISYYNLALIYYDLENYIDAEKYFNESIKIKNDYDDALFYLGELYRKNKQYDKGINCYQKSRNQKSKYKILQSYVEEGSLNKYQKELNEIIKVDKNDRRIASIASFASKEFNIKNLYPFCPEPLKYVHKSTIKNHVDNIDSFINKLIFETTNQNFTWEPSGRTAINGFVTKDLSEKEIDSHKKLEKIIFKEADVFLKKFENEKINFINNWPKNFKFVSWSNILTKEGYNIPHIHPSGWVSGVVYLKIPKNIKNDEAGIQFHLYGDDFISNLNEQEIKKITPLIGDIVMFPSSLFHSTIPFSSNEERMCIAFDLCGLDSV